MSKSITIDFEKCKGCWLCFDSCPSNLFQIGNKKNEKGYKVVQLIDESYCMGNKCLACVKICPDNAIIIPDSKSDIVPGVFYWLGQKVSKYWLNKK